jgi:glycosyltransferase involved in cell wall biosynthesis
MHDFEKPSPETDPSNKLRRGLAVSFIHGISSIGGGETDFLLLLDHLAAAGEIPSVLCPPGPLSDRLSDKGIRHFDIRVPGWRKGKDFVRRPFFFRKARGIMKEAPPDLIVANDIWYAPHAHRLAASSGAPWAAHIRGEVKHPGRARQYHLRHCDAIVTVNSKNRDLLREGGIPEEKINVIHPGIDMRMPEENALHEARKSVPEGRSPIVGIVANVLAVKGFQFLGEAVGILRSRFPRILCIVVGSTESDFAHRFRSGLREAADHFLFLGFRDDPLPFISLFDVMVLPSLSEGFGIVLLEGMSMRKPVVASSTGGIPEIVVDGKTGFLVPPGDAATLAEKITLLLENPDLRGSMGEEGYCRCRDNFGKEKALENIRRTYRRIVEGRPRC